MSTLTGTLEITGLRLETLEALEAKAKNFGQTPEEYARELLEDKFASAIDQCGSPTQTNQEEQKISPDEWMRQWEALTRRISAAIPDGPSLLDTLSEMRR